MSETNEHVDYLGRFRITEDWFPNSQRVKNPVAVKIFIFVRIIQTLLTFQIQFRRKFDDKSNTAKKGKFTRL